MSWSLRTKYFNINIFFSKLSQIILRFPRCSFCVRLTALLNLCPIYLKLPTHVQYNKCTCTRSKIKGDCQSYTKAAPRESRSDFTLVARIERSNLKVMLSNCVYFYHITEWLFIDAYCAQELFLILSLEFWQFLRLTKNSSLDSNM